MSFNSLVFPIFFPLVVGAFYALPQRWRWPLLLVASYAFYMGQRPEYALLLLAVTATTFVAARQMARVEGQLARRQPRRHARRARGVQVPGLRAGNDRGRQPDVGPRGQP